MKLDFYQCTRCGLIFAWDETPSKCPACWRRHSVPAQIMIAGRNVEVGRLLVCGDSAYMDHSFRSRLAAMDLGDRCPHGYISAIICEKCNTI